MTGFGAGTAAGTLAHIHTSCLLADINGKVAYKAAYLLNFTVCINGDLLVVIEEQEHKELKREGNNLFYTKIISLPDAILGAEVEVPCLDGPYRIKVEPGTQSGTVVRLRNKGLPTVNGYGGTGDMYVKIAVWIPKKLEKDEKAVIESLRGKESFTPNPTKEDKSFFDRLKDLF